MSNLEVLFSVWLILFSCGAFALSSERVSLSIFFVLAFLISGISTILRGVLV